jgi:hypothetical protein
VFELDHIAFAVADVESLRADWSALGFTPTAVGVCRWALREHGHQARATSIVFERGYLDLVEVQDEAWEQKLRTSPMYRRGVAPSGIVLASRAADPLEKSHRALAARGVAVGAPYGIERELLGAVPDSIRYEIFALREPCLPFAVIEDGAPGAMRVEQWLRHPNAASGVRRCHLLVPSLSAWVERSERVFGVRADAVLGLDLGATRLVAHEEPGDPYLGAVAKLMPRDERARLLAVELTVADMAAVRRELERSRVPAIEVDGGMGVEPTAGYGCGILFTELHGAT